MTNSIIKCCYTIATSPSKNRCNALKMLWTIDSEISDNTRRSTGLSVSLMRPMRSRRDYVENHLFTSWHLRSLQFSTNALHHRIVINKIITLLRSSTTQRWTENARFVSFELCSGRARKRFFNDRMRWRTVWPPTRLNAGMHDLALLRKHIQTHLTSKSS